MAWENPQIPFKTGKRNLLHLFIDKKIPRRNDFEPER
jgi:hypothetical protein